MADPSIFPFLDLLLAKVRALPACAEPVAVYDGAPGANAPDQLVAIGGDVTPLSDSKVRWAQLGARAMWEEYAVDLIVSCWSGGDTGTGSPAEALSNSAQRTVRQQATTIFNAIFEAVRADPDFSIANGGTPLVLYCNFDHVQVLQKEAAQGRLCEIRCALFVKNRISGN